MDPPPDAFAVVMGTGIVSIAAQVHGYRRIAAVLGPLAMAAFVVLGLGVLVRTVAQPRRVIARTRDPDVVLRMFTFVAACAVLQSGPDGHGRLSWVLAGLSVVGWLTLMARAVVAVRSRVSRVGGSLTARAHGGWLLPSVATTALAVEAAGLSTRSVASWSLWPAIPLWALGVLLYLAGVVLLARRAVTAFGPELAAPDSWILMGSLAISALAGAHIVTAARAAHQQALVTAFGSLTWAVWLVASGWIPPLLLATLWWADRVPGAVRYHGVWWSGVFPIGMYATASAATARTLGIPAARGISVVFWWVALVAWVVLLLGLAHTAGSALGRSRR